jgi:phosphatidylglycerophosphate synthase
VRARSMIKPVAVVATGWLLVVVAVTGTRALGRVDVEFRPLIGFLGNSVEAVLLAAAVLCLPLVVAGMIMRRRARRAEEGGNQEWLRRLVFLAVLVGAVVVLRELLPATPEQDAGTDTDPGQANEGPADVLWSGQAAALAVVLAVTALAVMWWRKHAAASAVGTDAGADEEPGVEALHAGEVALDRRWDDPRAAVVGCYAAMERVLARSGNPRRRAETPEELLDRAITEGWLAAAPGRRLTELFLTARYSSAPVTSADVEAARAALRGIQAGAVRWH